MWETKAPTRNLLRGIASERSGHVLEGASDTIRRALDVALSLGLLVFGIALDLTLLARRPPRLEAGHVADRLLHLSDSVLDAARHLAVINEPNVRVGDDTDRERGG
jgi:hypothetical protein